MKYMLLIYGNEELWSSFPQEELAKVVKETDALQQELRESGEFIGAWGVADQVNAKTVKLDDGVPVVTDGPYLEAKEYLGQLRHHRLREPRARARDRRAGAIRPLSARSRCGR